MSTHWWNIVPQSRVLRVQVKLTIYAVTTFYELEKKDGLTIPLIKANLKLNHYASDSKVTLVCVFFVVRFELCLFPLLRF
jgi:hypothetical protein